MKGVFAATQPSCNNFSPRLFVRAKGIGPCILVDTGSDVSAIPPRNAAATVPTSEYSLSAVNGSPISTHGTTEIDLDIGLPKRYTWNFLVADVQQPIIGGDFLEYFGLPPDLKGRKLIDSATLCSVPCAVRPSNQPSISLIRKTNYTDNRLQRLLQQHQAVTKPPQYHAEVRHDVTCFIETNGAPNYEKPRRLRADIEAEVKAEYRKQLNLGLINVSKSQWASGLIVKREKNKLRLIGDFRKLNAQTVPDRYPLPVISDAIAFLKNKTIFTKIDLVRAFHNIPVFKAHVEKTAVISPVGLFEYNRMPFGLRNAPATFQRFMDSIFSELDFCKVYIDDILIFSNNIDDHFMHLNSIFQRLVENGLSINLDKCVFCVSDLEFLGYRITVNGFQPTEERVEFFRKMTPPKTIAALRSILGLLNFYRQFTSRAAEVLAPLQDLLKGHPKKNDNTAIEWTPELLKNFERVREKFVDFTLLRYQKRGAKLVLTCDASAIAIGAVLEQIGENGEKEPLGFYSKKLEDRETRWPAYDLELHAIYSAIKHFEPMVEGRDLTIITDHKPLTYLFTTKKKSKIERRSRYAEYIAQFSTKIVHLAGSANVVADTLSRPEVIEKQIHQINAEITPADIAKYQEEDEEIRKWRKEGFRDQVLREVKLSNSTKLLCSVFQNVNRPVIPKKLRFQIYQQIHNVSHYGFKATVRLLRAKYYWPKMTGEIRRWHRACEECQRVKTQRHTIPPIGNFPDSDRFEHVHVDLVGPLKPSEGYTYLCTFIDRATRWVEAVPLRTVTAEKVAQAFYTHWVARYGTPLRITSDRGPQFRSDLFLELAKLLGAQHIQTTAYHPQANGLVERFHRRLKELLICYSKNWHCYLPSILLGIRAAPRDETGISSAEMVYGQTLRLPGELHQESEEIRDKTKFVEHLRAVLRDLKPAPFKHRRKEKIFIHQDLDTCKRVFVRVDKVRVSLEPPYQGPYTVIKRNKLFFEIDIDGKTETISISRLKPAYELDEAEKVQVETVATRPRSILKKGNTPPLVNEGKTSENTKINSRLIYINNDHQFPNDSPNPNPVHVTFNHPVSNFPNPEPCPQVAGHSEQNQISSRRSSRVKCPPVKLHDFVTK